MQSWPVRKISLPYMAIIPPHGLLSKYCSRHNRAFSSDVTVGRTSEATEGALSLGTHMV